MSRTSIFWPPPPVGTRVLVRSFNGLEEAVVLQVAESGRRIKLRDEHWPHAKYWRHRWNLDLLAPYAYFGIVEVLP